jgi:hypothetical protein
MDTFLFLARATLGWILLIAGGFIALPGTLLAILGIFLLGSGTDCLCSSEVDQ